MATKKHAVKKVHSLENRTNDPLADLFQEDKSEDKIVNSYELYGETIGYVMEKYIDKRPSGELYDAPILDEREIKDRLDDLTVCEVLKIKKSTKLYLKKVFDLDVVARITPDQIKICLTDNSYTNYKRLQKKAPSLCKLVDERGIDLKKMCAELKGK